MKGLTGDAADAGRRDARAARRRWSWRARGGGAGSRPVTTPGTVRGSVRRRALPARLAGSPRSVLGLSREVPVQATPHARYRSILPTGLSALRMDAGGSPGPARPASTAAQAALGGAAGVRHCRARARARSARHRRA